MNEPRIASPSQCVAWFELADAADAFGATAMPDRWAQREEAGKRLQQAAARFTLAWMTEWAKEHYGVAIREEPTP